MSTPKPGRMTPNMRFDEIGVSGTRRVGGWVLEPQSRELQGEQGRKIFRQMAEEDAIVGAMLFALKMLLRSVSYDIEPPEDNPTSNEKKVAEFVGECLGDMSESWDDTLSAILSFLDYGFAFAEIVYKIRRGPNEADPMYRSQYTDGRIGWRKIANRAQDTLHHWELDDKGGVQGMWQWAAPDYQVTLIPIEKALLFRTSTERGSPEGRSVLLNSWRSWRFKRNIETLEGIGVERDLAGLPIIYADSDIFGNDADADQQAMLAKLQEIVSNIRNDEHAGLVMPLMYDDNNNQMFKFELATTGGARAHDTNAIIDRYNQAIAMTVLADFILLGHDAVGSKALSVSKIGVLTRAVQAWAEAIAAVFNRHAIPRLLKLNNITVDRMPEMRPGKIEEIDLGQLGAYVQALSAAGASLFPNEDLLRDLLQKADLPDDLPEDMGAATPELPTPAKPETPETPETPEGEPAASATGGTEPATPPTPPEPVAKPDPNRVVVAGHTRAKPGTRNTGA